MGECSEYVYEWITDIMSLRLRGQAKQEVCEVNFSYDDTADALYIQVAGSLVARTHQIDAGTMVDVDNFGKVVGIEVLQPARDWPLKEIQSRFKFSQHENDIFDSLWGDTPGRLYPFAKPLMVSA